METGGISDAHITASSEWDGDHAAVQGRLNFKVGGGKMGAWSAGSNDVNQWLQIDLGNPHTKVTGFATQGRNGVDSQRVTVYKLQYSLDGNNFYYYMDHAGGEAQFAGNTDSDTVIHHTLAIGYAITARYIRFRPTAWHGHISMRVELYGCEVSEPKFAAAHIPELRFDGGASDRCFPDEATDSNDGECRTFNSNAPIYYDIRDCGDYRKIVWWIWYGYQKTCDCCSGAHDNDWEHITINFIKDGSFLKQDSVTWFQHDGWYTRSNTAEHPKIYVGKSSHGSYDNWCDGKGASWEQDYCPGGCGYWNDYRNDKKSSPWIPHNIKHISEVTGTVSYRKRDGKDSKLKDEKQFDDTTLNKCSGGDWRCVKGPCGCWRNNHEFGAPQCDFV